MVQTNGLRYGAAFYHLKLNPLDQMINHAYPQADTIDAAALSLDLPIRFIELQARLAAQDSDAHGRDAAVMLGLRFDLGRL